MNREHQASEQFVTVATFGQAVEAQMALNRLEEEGIDAMLLGGITTDAFAGIGGLSGVVQLEVPETDAETAREILAACAGAESPPDVVRARSGEDESGLAATAIQAAEAPSTAFQETLEEANGAGTPPAEAAARDAIPGWACPGCGQPVGYELTRCPACGAASQGIQSPDELETSLPPSADEQERDEELDAEALKRRFADDLAVRAFRAAVGGCLTLPLLGLWTPLVLFFMPLGLLYFVPLGLWAYSVWLLFRLSLMTGELSPAGMRRVYLALLIDVPVIILNAILIRGWFR